MKKQLRLNLDKGRKGGRREGAGRPRLHSAGVAHRKRDTVTRHTPVHINFKYRLGIRSHRTLSILKRALLNAEKKGLRVVHFSLEHNHIHLIAEVENDQALSKGMRSITVTLVRGLDKGAIQLERFHLHVLKTLKETENALDYVLFNHLKHGGKRLDQFSSYGSKVEARSYILKRAILKHA